MTRGTSRRALQVLLSLVGMVMFVFGVVPMVFGADSILGAGAFTASLDSEVRFFGAWYAAAGVVVLRAVPRVEFETTVIRAVAAVFFMAGSARLLSLIVVGEPHPVTLVLMVVELALPFVIIPWQASVARNDVGH